LRAGSFGSENNIAGEYPNETTWLCTDVFTIHRYLFYIFHPDRQIIIQLASWPEFRQYTCHLAFYLCRPGSDYCCRCDELEKDIETSTVEMTPW
jgi:hypothetical protein